MQTIDVIEPKLHAEIDQAQDELRIAREQFAGAAGLYIDAAAMKVSACEMRLNCLYAEVRREPKVHEKDTTESWYECRYCDGGFRPITTVDGEKVCPNCGAEWDPVLIEEPGIKDGE